MQVVTVIVGGKNVRNQKTTGRIVCLILGTKSEERKPMETNINPVDQLKKLEVARAGEIPVWPETRSGNEQNFDTRNAPTYRRLALEVAGECERKDLALRQDSVIINNMRNEINEHNAEVQRFGELVVTETEKARSKGFVQGCALAVATLIRLHGESVEARDLCRELGVNGIAYLKSNDVEPYDLEVLIPFIQKEFVEREARIAESKRLRGNDA
jgi:hypothetical protein